ncbi:MAG TPA: nuclear transport factor 2 family protein, partial [Acetobacteraceae bacterium]|nr:nuclear transport factor 2 family protein [Acetobacteraceae bacterium]
ILAPLGAAPAEPEMVAFRRAITEAIAARDEARLAAMYAPSFVHTHGSGRMDGREARIASLLAGEPVIENAPVTDWVVRQPAPDTAIVTGRSPILNTREDRTYEFRWVQIFVRVEGRWLLAASQATRLPAVS